MRTSPLLVFLLAATAAAGEATALSAPTVMGDWEWRRFNVGSALTALVEADRVIVLADAGGGDSQSVIALRLADGGVDTRFPARGVLNLQRVPAGILLLDGNGYEIRDPRTLAAGKKIAWNTRPDHGALLDAVAAPSVDRLWIRGPNETLEAREVATGKVLATHVARDLERKHGAGLRDGIEGPPIPLNWGVLAVSPDGKRFASLSSHLLALYSVDGTDLTLQRIHSCDTRFLWFAGDGRYLTAGESVFAADDIRTPLLTVRGARRLMPDPAADAVWAFDDAVTLVSPQGIREKRWRLGGYPDRIVVLPNGAGLFVLGPSDAAGWLRPRVRAATAAPKEKQ